MGKTTLTNNVGFSVQVKEGNSNIFRILRVLQPGASMTIKADSSATYREYVLILLPDNKKLRPLSSDDIQELNAIEIFQVEESGEIKYDWKELRAERRGFLATFRDLFSPKPGAIKAASNVEASAGSDATAVGNVEANAQPSISPSAPQ